MCKLRLKSRVDYFGMIYTVERITKKGISINPITPNCSPCDLRLNLVLRELELNNLRVLEV